MCRITYHWCKCLFSLICSLKNCFCMHIYIYWQVLSYIYINKHTYKRIIQLLNFVNYLCIINYTHSNFMFQLSETLLTCLIDLSFKHFFESIKVLDPMNSFVSPWTHYCLLEAKWYLFFYKVHLQLYTATADNIVHFKTWIYEQTQ